MGFAHPANRTSAKHREIAPNTVLIVLFFIVIIPFRCLPTKLNYLTYSFTCNSRMGLFCRMDAEMAALAPTQRAKWAIT